MTPVTEQRLRLSHPVPLLLRARAAWSLAVRPAARQYRAALILTAVAMAVIAGIGVLGISLHGGRACAQQLAVSGGRPHYVLACSP